MNTEEQLLNVPDDLKEYLNVPESPCVMVHRYVQVSATEYRRAYYPRYHLAIKRDTKDEAAAALFDDIRKMRDQDIELVSYHVPPSIMQLEMPPESPGTKEGAWVAFFYPHLYLMPDFAEQYAESLRKLQSVLASATEEGNIAGQ